MASQASGQGLGQGLGRNAKSPWCLHWALCAPLCVPDAQGKVMASIYLSMSNCTSFAPVLDGSVWYGGPQVCVRPVLPCRTTPQDLSTRVVENWPAVSVETHSGPGHHASAAQAPKHLCRHARGFKG